MNLIVCAQASKQDHVAVEGDGEDVAAVVVGMFADEVDATGRAEGVYRDARTIGMMKGVDGLLVAALLFGRAVAVDNFEFARNVGGYADGHDDLDLARAIWIRRCLGYMIRWKIAN